MLLCESLVRGMFGHWSNNGCIPLFFALPTFLRSWSYPLLYAGNTLNFIEQCRACNIYIYVCLFSKSSTMTGFLDCGY
ncbi:hypothetical protein BDN70DRAFT_887123, partial [Pholiota conissans]